MLGIVCENLGHNVQVLERHPKTLLPPRGAGIVLGECIEALFRLYGASLPSIAVRNT